MHYKKENLYFVKREELKPKVLIIKTVPVNPCISRFRNRVLDNLDFCQFDIMRRLDPIDKQELQSDWLRHSCMLCTHCTSHRCSRPVQRRIQHRFVVLATLR